jgi:hypothetical protein
MKTWIVKAVRRRRHVPEPIMKIITIVILLTLLLSCGPHRRIVVHNASGEEASVSWYIKEDSIHSSPVYLNNSRESTVRLGSVEGKNRFRLTAGVGLWKPAAVANFADDLDSMVLRWGSRSVRIDSAERIAEYLMARRGTARDRIRITLSNPDSSRNDH